MEIEINSKRNNPFFNRTEIHFTVYHDNDGTPNREIIRSELAEKMNAKKENIIIDSINSMFGVHQSRGYAKVYTSREKAENLEHEYILKRNQVKGKQEKKEETKPETGDTEEKKESEPEKEEQPPEEEKKE